MPTVSETLKAARIAAGMTVRDAAGWANCAHPWIVQLETGTRSVSSATVRRMAAAYRLGEEETAALVTQAEDERRERMRVRRERMRATVDPGWVDVTGRTDAEVVERLVSRPT